MDLSQIPACAEDGIHVVVEIPKESENKFEYDKELGVITLDRVLDASIRYPTEYGFVPSTRSSDGELLDCMVMVERSTFPGCLIKARLIGVLTITHSSGLPEHKLLAVPLDDPHFDEYHDVSDLPDYRLKEIVHFFDVYKDLEGSDITVGGWEGSERAQQVLDEAVQSAQKEGIPGSHG